MVKSNAKYFLPGGGIKKGESYEACLKCECLEEIGYKVEVSAFLGEAENYFYSTNSQEILAGEGIFYEASIYGESEEPTEEDHQLVWVNIDKAASYLYLKHHAWAVTQVFKNMEGI